MSTTRHTMRTHRPGLLAPRPAAEAVQQIVSDVAVVDERDGRVVAVLPLDKAQVMVGRADYLAIRVAAPLAADVPGGNLSKLSPTAYGNLDNDNATH